MSKQQFKLKLNNYIVFDCETGGLDRKNQCHAINHPITDIALISLRGDTLQEFKREHLFIRGKENEKGEYVGYGEGMVYQEQALKFTNISIEKLEEKGIDYKEAADRIYQLISDTNTGSFRNKPILVGHNVTYDIPFLQMLMHLAKKDLSKVLEGYKDHLGNFHPNYLDTMWLSRGRVAKEGEKHNLQACCNRSNVDLLNAHTALDDTLATAELFKYFITNLRGDNSKGEVKRFRDDFKFEL